MASTKRVSSPPPEVAPTAARAHAAAPALRSALLAWFDRHRRDLPWRRTADPYAIWISEIMLQQTQVERVVPYFERFMARFPTIEALGEATVSDVLSVWRGLGYYTRARSLHRAARELVAGGLTELPRTIEELSALPGFGPYTAGAVASIAFGLQTPAVDGNVARVLSRVFELEGAPGDRDREARLWAAATELVAGPRPGDFNQALMELGATVCSPSAPLCLLCPLQALCGARAHGRVAAFPAPRKALPRKRLELAVAVVERDGTVLLARRGEGGLFGGLWEMPATSLENRASGYSALREVLGKRATIGPELSVIERTLTHRELVLHLFPVSLPPRLKDPPSPYVEWRWVPFAECAQLGMSSAMETALHFALPQVASPKPKRPRRAATRKAPG